MRNLGYRDSQRAESLDQTPDPIPADDPIVEKGDWLVVMMVREQSLATVLGERLAKASKGISPRRHRIYARGLVHDGFKRATSCAIASTSLERASWVMGGQEVAS
ncbi:uncharacterized protein PG998_004250 [Apiospora kogelbergensis]|uniref:Uncharacterized protein n=1 Tax=Apiospora kogelbergensis TaxID=1337665 RepID=A0AAW0QJC8_9PEZI